MAFLFLIILFCFEQRASRQIAIFCFFVNKNNIFPLYSKKIYGKILCNILNFPMFYKTITVFWGQIARPSRKRSFRSGQVSRSGRKQSFRSGQVARRAETHSVSTMEKVESHKIESLTLRGGVFRL